MTPAPSVGRIVHVHHKDFKGQPRPAQITFVHEDGTVALNMQRASGIDETYKILPLSKMTLHDSPPNGPELEGGEYWANWMPYQTGGERAAKQQDVTSMDNELAEVQRRVGDLERRVREINPGVAPAPLRLAAGAEAMRPLSLNVGFIAAKTHAGWLGDWDRSYSPYNKPWEALSDQARRGISRQARNAVDHLAEQLHAAGIAYEIADPYAEMGPGPIPEMDEAPTQPLDLGKVRDSIGQDGFLINEDEVRKVIEHVIRVHGLRLHIPAPTPAPFG